ncbi:MAG TPA: UPF0149 family protein, partial [Blastocatellia bacterium]|nr:UPF0149 family protein [Blastocatellia bacterium]
SQPLEDAEFDELDHFLLSDAASEETLTLSALDGYQTALVIGPATVMPSRWLPGVWGESADSAPDFATLAQAQRIMGMLMRHMNGIVAAFQTDPAAFEPMFDTFKFKGREYLCGEAWAIGFMKGVELARADWRPLFDRADMVEVLRPLHLLGYGGITPEDEKLVNTPARREKLTRRIPQSLAAIHAFWLPYRAAAHAERAPVRRTAPKVGRNEPCPCGSGLKFKKCCGVEATHH